MAKHRVAYRKKHQNHFSMVLVALVVALITVAMTVQIVGMKQRYDDITAKEAELQERIDAEDLRSEEIDNFRKYTQTKRYYEEMAKDKLGLVYEGEIVFKEEN